MKERTILPFRTRRLISRCGRFNLIQHNLTFVEALSLVAKVPVLAARIFRNVFMEGKHAGMPISGMIVAQSLYSFVAVMFRRLTGLVASRLFDPDAIWVCLKIVYP